MTLTRHSRWIIKPLVHARYSFAIKWEDNVCSTTEIIGYYDDLSKGANFTFSPRKTAVVKGTIIYDTWDEKIISESGFVPIYLNAVQTLGLQARPIQS